MNPPKNNSSRVVVTVMAILSALLAAAAAVFYVPAYKNEFNDFIRHYAADDPLFRTVTVLLLACAVPALIVLIFTRGSKCEMHYSQGETFSVILTGLMFAAFGVVWVTGEPVVGTKAFDEACIKLIPYLSFLSAVPFLLASSEKTRGTTFHEITSMFPVLWAAALVFRYYFDYDVHPLNDPEIILNVICLCAVMLLMLSESRIAIGVVKPAYHAAACIIAFIPCAIGIARIWLYYKGSAVSTTVMENFMFAVFAVLAVSRLASLPKKLSEYRESLPDDISPDLGDPAVPTDGEN